MLLAVLIDAALYMPDCRADCKRSRCFCAEWCSRGGRGMLLLFMLALRGVGLGVASTLLSPQPSACERAV